MSISTPPDSATRDCSPLITASRLGRVAHGQYNIDTDPSTSLNLTIIKESVVKYLGRLAGFESGDLYLSS